MYKCFECGCTFDEDEILKVREGRGECRGVPSYEEMWYCPACGDTGFEWVDEDEDSDDDIDEDEEE